MLRWVGTKLKSGRAYRLLGVSSAPSVVDEVRLPTDVAGLRDRWPSRVAVKRAIRRVGPPQSLVGRSSLQPVFKVAEIEGHLDGVSAASLQQRRLFGHRREERCVRAPLESRFAQRREGPEEAPGLAQVSRLRVGHGCHHPAFRAFGPGFARLRHRAHGQWAERHQWRLASEFPHVPFTDCPRLRGEPLAQFGREWPLAADHCGTSTN
jgi:hypothetical protein